MVVMQRQAKPSGKRRFTPPALSVWIAAPSARRAAGGAERAWPYRGAGGP